MSDLKQINGVWYDFGCKNQSFLQTAKELQVLGIKNYYFMLRIDDPRVADIDPFNPKITDQEIRLLMHEYKNNMWSFSRTAVRLRTDAGVVPYGLHRGLAAGLFNFERHQDFCLCEPRQTWKTTGLLGGPLQWAFQLSQNLTMHFFGKETENTKKNLDDLKNDIELLPEWLQFRRYMSEDGKIKKARQSSEILMNNLLHNQLKIHPKPSSLSHAQGLGRGGSGAIIYYDEIEHTPFFGEILSNSAPLFKTASENAAAVGKPYCRCMSCTPGNLDTREGLEALPIIKSMIPWTERVYDMTPEELAEYKSAFIDQYHSSEEKHEREVIDVFYIEYQYYQVRKTYQWVQEQYKLTGDKMGIRREILMQRLRGSNNSPIKPEDIEFLISNMKKSVRDFIINNKWRYLVYEHGAGADKHGKQLLLNPYIPYLVGVDPSAGGGGDNFSVTICNPYNLQVAAEFKSPYISGPQAVRMLVSLVHDYIPKCVIDIEKNSMGITIIQMICEDTDIKENLYWSEKDAAKQIEDLTNEGADDYELKKMSAEMKKYGTYMTGKVRAAMLEILFNHIDNCKEILNTEYLVDDICKLVRTKTGRIEALKGEHDDCLFSYLHAMNMYYNGDNLERFGIVKTEHPIFGPIQLEDTRNDRGLFDDFFSTEKVTFEEVSMKDAARLEEQIKDLVDKFDFVHDEVYSKMRDYNDNPYDDTVNISSSFFDYINGV